MPNRSRRSHQSRRPLVLIPARFSDTASALRYRAEVGARALIEAVYVAGGEPLLMHPHAPGGVADLDDVRARIAVADAILLPGGGDLHASWTNQTPDPSAYDVDMEQDAFDLALASAALQSAVPLLAICRGTQAVNVALGGTLTQDMRSPHRHFTHTITPAPATLLAKITGPLLRASCYHHQCVDRLAAPLVATAHAADGIIEAVELPTRQAWFIGTQWHPEDTAATDPAQAALFKSFIDAALDD
ncbi:MAG TPA: gamma-glutamyl-gamma-aminobutyrate hydrolase family protein [Actinospica sp.]|nr:gamma-glutamyl-gamma-aminobutyrate hydrolase family protein [Actinospica sp.]